MIFTPPKPNFVLVVWNPDELAYFNTSSKPDINANLGYVQSNAPLVLLGSVELTGRIQQFQKLTDIVQETSWLYYAHIQEKKGAWLPKTSQVGNQEFCVSCPEANLKLNDRSGVFTIPDELPAKGYWLVSELLAQTVTPDKPASFTVGQLITQELATGNYKGADGEDGKNGTDGNNGTDGLNGYAPIVAAVVYGEKRVLCVVDWEGGSGAKPATGYVGAAGLVADIAQATDIRGAMGAPGSSSSISKGGGSVSVSDVGAIVLHTATGKSILLGSVEVDMDGNFITPGTGIYLRSNFAALYMGLNDDVAFFRNGANAVRTGALALKSVDSQGYGLYVEGKNGGHITAIVQAANGQSVSTLAAWDSAGTERSGINKTQDLETKGTRGFVTEDRTMGARVKLIFDNGKIVVRSLDSNNNETATLGTWSKD